MRSGYSAGEAPLPSPPVSVNVMDLGATGDGKTDDTPAFLAAIEAVSGGGVVYIPPGVGQTSKCERVICPAATIWYVIVWKAVYWYGKFA